MHRCRTRCAYTCVMILASTASAETRPLMFLSDFIVSMVCIVIGHPLPPLSEQLDKIYLVMCQGSLFFPISMPASIAAFYLSLLTSSEPCTMISRSLSRMQTERGNTGQQLTMSGENPPLLSFIVLVLYHPLLVTLQHSHNLYRFLPNTKDVRFQYVV